MNAGRQHHHGAFVENDLQLQPKRVDGFEYGGLVGLPRRHNHPPGREWLDAGFPEPGHKPRRRWIGEGSLLPRIGAIEQSAILGDHSIEQIKPGHDTLQVFELASRDENEPPLRRSQLFQRCDRGFIDNAIMSEKFTSILGYMVLASIGPSGVPSYIGPFQISEETFSESVLEAQAPTSAAETDAESDDGQVRIEVSPSGELLLLPGPTVVDLQHTDSKWAPHLGRHKLSFP